MKSLAVFGKFPAFTMTQQKNFNETRGIFYNLFLLFLLIILLNIILRENTSAPGTQDMLIHFRGRFMVSTNIVNITPENASHLAHASSAIFLAPLCGTVHDGPSGGTALHH